MSCQSIHFANKPISHDLNDKQIALVKAARSRYYMPNPNNNKFIDYYNNMVIIDETEGGNKYSPGMFLMRQLTHGYSESRYGCICNSKLAFRNLVFTRGCPTVPELDECIDDNEMNELLSAIDTQYAEMTSIITTLNELDDDSRPIYELGDDSAEASEFDNTD